MATMWFSKDGRRPNTQHGPGTELTLDEISAIFASDELRYVGTEAPSINPEAPSQSEKNVVVEINATEGFSARMPNAGYYLVVGVQPMDAEQRLRDHRNAA